MNIVQKTVVFILIDPLMFNDNEEQPLFVGQACCGVWTCYLNDLTNWLIDSLRTSITSWWLMQAIVKNIHDLLAKLALDLKPWHH